MTRPFLPHDWSEHSNYCLSCTAWKFGTQADWSCVATTDPVRDHDDGAAVDGVDYFAANRSCSR